MQHHNLLGSKQQPGMCSLSHWVRTYKENELTVEPATAESMLI